MTQALGGSLTTASYSKWARNPVNIGLYNARMDGRRTIVHEFETELQVANKEDRPIILDLLKRLVFLEPKA